MKRNVAIVVLVVVVVAAVACLKHRTGAGEPEPAANLPRLVELGAGKCESCKKMAPIIEELRKEYAGRVIVESIDVIQEREKSLAYNWRLIPTQVLLDADGREVWRNQGFVPKTELIARLSEVGVK